MRNKVLVLVLLCLCPTLSWAVEPLSFTDFSRKVLAYYPKLKAAHQDVDIALARQMRSSAGFWPSLGLDAGYRVSDDPVDVFGMLLRQERFTSSDFDLKRLNTPSRHQVFSSGVHVEAPLFDSMQTILSVRSAREQSKAAQDDESFTRQEALVLAQDAYLHALAIGRIHEELDRVQSMADDDLKKAADLKEKGMVLGADYFAAKVMFGNLTRMKNEASRQRKAMITLLNILMGEVVSKEWMLAGDVKDESPMLDQPSLQETALIQRKDVQALESHLKAAAADVSRSRAAVLPDVRMFGSATNDKDRLSSSGGNNFTLGVKGSLALFDPSRAARIREAKALHSRLEHDIRLYKDAVSRQVNEEFSRYAAFWDNLNVYKGMMQDARQAVDLILPLYNEGRKSIKDLLDARCAYVHAVQSYQTALAGGWIAKGRLLFLSGALDEAEMEQWIKGAGL